MIHKVEDKGLRTASSLLISPPNPVVKTGVSDGSFLTPKSSLDPSKNNSTKEAVREWLFFKRADKEITYIPAESIVTLSTNHTEERIKALNAKHLSCWLSDTEFDENDYVLEAFRDYLEVANKRRLVVRKADGKGGAPIVYSAPNRFSYGYQRKVREALRPLLHERNFRNCVMLTLTIDPKKMSKSTAWRIFGEELNRFYTSLFRGIADEHEAHLMKLPEKLRKHAWVDEYEHIDNLPVIEAQKNGYPHAHILFFNVRRLLDWRVIRDMWGLGHTWINGTPEGVKITNPVAYMFKYITKTFTKTDAKNELTHAYLWFYHRRSYHASKGLVAPLNSLTGCANGEYTLVGLVICDDKNLASLQDNPQLFDALIRGLG